MRCAAVTILCLALALGGGRVASAQHGEEGAHGASGPEAESAHPEDAGGHGGGHPPIWWPFFLVQAIGFAGVLAIGWKFAWPAVRRGLDGRGARIREAFERGETEGVQSQKLLTDWRDRLQGFAVEAQRRRDEALRQGRTLRSQMEEEARAQAAQLIAKARQEAEFEGARARAEIRQAVIERAFAEAEQSLRRAVDDRLQGVLVEQVIGELERMPAIGV